VLYIAVQLNYVLFIFRERPSKRMMSLNQYEVADLRMSDDSVISDSEYEMLPNAKAYSLDVLCSHLRAYEHLVNYMCAEHCFEYLLFLTEINQFKQRMLSDYFIPMEVDKIVIDDMRNSLVKMSKDLPQSRLVYSEQVKDGDDSLRVFRNVILRLYEKYIKNGSELEIKTTYILQKRFDFWMEDEGKCIISDEWRGCVVIGIWNTPLVANCVFFIFGIDVCQQE